jgi:sulfide:quinone oxidoreductase
MTAWSRVETRGVTTIAGFPKLAPQGSRMAARAGRFTVGSMSAGRPLRIVVAGGGFAAAELMLALKAQAEERVALELVAPSTELVYRPAATGTPFERSQVDRYDLGSLAREVGAAVRRDTVEAVAPRARRIRLRSGAAVEYDALVLALGARARAPIPGAITFRDQRDAHLVARMVEELRAPEGRRVVFAAPSGVSWTLPLYELALMTAAEIERRGLDVETTLVTPEAAPLQAFGPAVSDPIGSLLADRGIRRLRGVAHSVGRSRLTLTGGEALRADRVVAVPRLVGRRVAGVPADWNGFVATDSHGRVCDTPDVFAAGDMTQFQVKQGGLATQQADVIAAVLAARSGADVEVPPVRHILRTCLLAPDGPLYLRAELDGDGRPLPPTETPQVSREPLWWPPAKVFGRYLTPWMATQHLVPV